MALVKESRTLAESLENIPRTFSMRKNLGLKKTYNTK